MKMFARIQELIDDKDALVFVLIDEVSFFRVHSIFARNIAMIVSAESARGVFATC